MAKTPITITLDPDIAKIAKEKNINVSGTINRLLHEFLKPKISDLADKNIKVVCGKCGEEITEGYRCDFSKLLLCQECQDNFNMKRCPPGPFGLHEHTKWTRETSKK